ncbi:MAG: DUF167 domain-containing protein [Pirellulales bacterium]
MIELAAHPQGVILPVKAHAGARRDAIEGCRQGMLRVSVTQAPEKGKANKAIVALLSKTLGVAKRRIELVSGATSPEKRFLISGVEVDSLREMIAQAIEP